jgi:hypothetical protein
MKGLIYCEFLEMVEKKFGYEVVDRIIRKSDLKSEGVYTSVGTYPHSEIFSLVKSLSLEINVPIEKLFYTFGKYVFGIFGKIYKEKVDRYDNAFSFLNRIEDTIHVEVLKLYPEAELPTIQTKCNGTNRMELMYFSKRKMAYFAEGLIQGCMDYFNEKAEIKKEVMSEDHDKVLFTILKV